MVTDGAALAAGLASALREAGLAAPTGDLVVFAQALALVGVTERARVLASARATLLPRHEDTVAFDVAFDRWWTGVTAEVHRTPLPPPPVVLLVDEPGGSDPGAGEARTHDGPVLQLRFSDQEVLSHRDLASCTPDELAEAHALLARLRLAGARTRTRRLRPTNAGSGATDLRRTVRTAMRNEGEVLSIARRRPGTRRRRVVLLLDVSGSMEPYARAFVRFAHAALLAHGRVEVFALGTRCTRLTHDLRTRDVDAALRAATARAEDWSGGTRLGEGLRTFNDRWGVRGLARGAVVVVLSDGWDRGDTALLGTEMQRLHRVTHRLVWANPLKAGPGYAPLAAGMAAALPHVDAFVEGHSVAALGDLADLIAR